MCEEAVTGLSGNEFDGLEKQGPAELCRRRWNLGFGKRKRAHERISNSDKSSPFSFERATLNITS
jgi:hypothetical protein